MTEITQTVAGRIHTVILAPVTAYVVMQVADKFLETFVPRREAEKSEGRTRSYRIAKRRGYQVLSGLSLPTTAARRRDASPTS